MNDHIPDDETARECHKVLHQNRECPAADTLVSFREEELAPDDAVTVAAHLGGCPECARLIEQLDEAEGLMTEDASYLAGREEDRHQVAKALGFRVGRPPATPLLQRLSWIWEARIPALAPAAVCAMLLAVILWPAAPESPVNLFNQPFQFTSDDMQLRGGAGEYNAPVNSLITVSHYFMRQKVEEGTMVSGELTGTDLTVHLLPQTVIMAGKEGVDTDLPCVVIPLQINKPGIFHLRLSHPENAFEPVVLKIVVTDR